MRRTVKITGAALAAICVSAAVWLACGKPAEERAPAARAAAAPPFASFRDIPGVTAAEAEAVEALARSRGAFVYGMTVTTEAFLTDDDGIGGYAALFCKWLTGLFGIPFELHVYTWDGLRSGLSNLEIDFTGDLMATEERRKTHIMTDAIIERSLSAFQMADAGAISEIAASRAPRFVFLDQSAVLDRVEPLVNYAFEPVFVGDNAAAYDLIESGKADAILVMGVAEAAFDAYGGVKSEAFFPLVYNSASMSTQNPKLAPVISVVQKALRSENVRGYLIELYKAGYVEYRKHKLRMKLTGEERAYLWKNPVVKIGAEYDNYPVCFYNSNEGEWQGAVFFVFREIEEFTGIAFEVANSPNKEFSGLIKMLEAGEVSLLSEVLRTKEREGRFLWPGTPIMVDFSTLISKADYPGITLPEILNIRVGAAQGTAHAELFKRWFPDHNNFFEYYKTFEVWDALERGDIDMVMSRRNQFLALSNYKERAGYKVNVAFENYFYATFGINKDETVLCSILDKTLALIDTKRIAGNWTNKFLDYRYKLIEAQRPWLIGATALSLVTLVLILTLFYRSRAAGRRLVKQQAEVEAASRAKSSFLAAMSHEMRTPMNAIIGMTSIGKNTADTERKNYALGKIEDAAVHLLSVINDVLDISKIEANKLELSPVEFSLEKMLQRIVNIINFRMDEKRQKFTLNVGENLPRIVFGDDHHLSQVILNLLSNAVKFSPEHGKIALNVSLAGEKDGVCEMRVEVADNGIGITPEKQAKLFQAFQQADSGISREFGGTGLGLSISKHIVELMGGKIWIESERGKGSRFIFTVNVSRGKSGAGAPLAASGGEGGGGAIGKFTGKKLLLAEDVEINREIMVSLLEETEIIIDCAKNGLEAVEMISEDVDKYDIVLMDVQMPKMDGLEATRRIRAMDAPRLRGLPIIAMTAHVFKSDIDECAKAGMNDHIGKPIDIEDVLEKLRKHLGGGNGQ
ncbi:MAG: response regulator [Chitinispirillales bacterium]|jgi:signal transduction histidine kinase/CheY-like chemotaxis protein|nr:response regulator [Chitinispirillales bacterium]